MTRNATPLGEIDVASLPASLNTEQAAPLLGLTRVGLWGMARNGNAPVPFFHAGRAVRWPTAPILRLLGLDEGSAPGPAGASPDDTGRDDTSNAGAA